MVRDLLHGSQLTPKEQTMASHDDEAEKKASSTRLDEGKGGHSTPKVQTPDKPSQAEGDRETIDKSISEKEADGDL